MLCKYIIVRCCYRTFKSQSNCTYHCYQQLLTCNNLQIRMYPILSNTQISYRRSPFSIISPKRIGAASSILLVCSFTLQIKGSRNFGVNVLRKRTAKSLKSTKANTKCQNTGYWISTSLMCQNLSRRNIQKHHNKQEQNCLCSHINQLLQQYKIFQSLQYQQPRTMQKLQYQIKYRVYRVFRLCHLIYTHQCTSCYQSKNLTHLLLYDYLSQGGFEPPTFELKARCSTIELPTHREGYK